MSNLYIIEIRKYYEVTPSSWNGHVVHIGYMNKLFSSYQEALDYYTKHVNFPLEEHDLITGLVYKIIDYKNENMTITPFNEISRRCTLSNDYGPFILHKITYSEYILRILEEIDDSIYTKDILMDAASRGHLYTVDIKETNSMFKRKAGEDEIFIKHSFYILPCFCIAHDRIIETIWVHPRARYLGIASFMIKELNISRIGNLIHKDVKEKDFWKKLGFSVEVIEP